MARSPTKAELLRAQRTRLLNLRHKRHAQDGHVRKLTWWAEEYGIEYQTLKKVAAGERPLQNDDALTIAKYHGVRPEWVLYGIGDMVADEGLEAPPTIVVDEEVVPTVPLLGWVSAGSAVIRTPLNESELDRVLAPPGSTERTRALEIRGESLGELFDRWIVYFDDEQRPISPDLVNRLCVVSLTDGRVMVKKIKRSGRGFDLHSNTEEPIRDVQIKWAARVKHMAPR